MDENEELDYDSMSLQELENLLDKKPTNTSEGSDESTDTSEPDEQITSKFHEKHGLVREDEKGYKTVPNFVRTNQAGEVVPIEWLGYKKLPRTGFGGALKDTGESLWNKSAPIVGVSDTLIDFINFASADGGKWDIPKLPTYENKASQAVRNISGLVIPSLRLRGMVLGAAQKAHATKTAAPWLQNLGNKKSFEYFARFGVDVGTGGLVDYVAEQNQNNDTALTQIANFWPETRMFIPDYMLTGPDKTADQIRLANVAEGGVFNVFAGIIEGAAYINAYGKSVKRTAEFIPTDGKSAKALNEAAKGKYDDIKFSDVNEIENSVLKRTAEKNQSLKELGEYYQSKTELPNKPTVGLHDVFDTTEDLVIPASESNTLLRAQVNAAEIANNFESSYGRLNNIIKESARKNGIEVNNLMDRTLVMETTEKLKKGGSFKYKTNSGKIITEKMIKDAGDHLAATLLHPRVDKEDILSILREFKESVDGSIARIVGKKGVTQALNTLKKQMADLDVYKAKAYLVTSEAGQISDMAEGARLMEGSESVQRTIDLMSDRLEVLMVEKGLANFEAGSMLQNMKAWKQAVATGDKEVIDQAAQVLVDNNKAALTEIIPQAKEWSSTIKEIARDNPEFVKPLLLASELADGDVDKLWKLHRWAAENLGTWHKLIRDGNPQVPSIINKALMSNIFNSMLSAPTTPIAAGIGNLTGLFGKSQAQIWGAALSGDFGRTKDAITAWYALDDTLQKSIDHMRLVFRKASNNPKEISYTMRSDIALKETKELSALRAYADAASANGEDGAKGLLQIFDDLEALAADPVLRFGSNAMSGLDGFSKSVLANSEAKYRALWKATQEGEVLTKDAFYKAHDEIYNSFFDSKQMLSGEAIDANAREIALNADSPMISRMNDLIREWPIIRSVVWFPRTTANVLDTFTKWSPAGIFSRDWHELWGTTGTKHISEFTDDQIIEHLTKRGKPVDKFYRETFEMFRYEVKGKAALSGFLLTAAFMAGMNDRCTGTGHVNKAIQSKRIQRGWKKKSCKVPGTDKQISYEWMGPVGDWLSLALDLVDNADTLNTGQWEIAAQQLWAIGAANFSDKQVLTQLEPLFDVLQGNGAAALRWQSNLLNNLLPMGSGRQWLGKMMYPQLREVNTNLGEALRNKNAWLDAFDPTRKLPELVDPIDGNQINDLSWWQRLSNNIIKTTDRPSPVNQWLIDIEYTGSTAMNLSNRGALLEKSEITAINSIIGKQGHYKSELLKIKQRADSLTYTDPITNETYTGFREILRAARKGNISSEVLDTTKFASVFNDITTAYNRAKRYAEESLRYGNKAERQMWAEIQAREFKVLHRKHNTEIGNLEQLYRDEKEPLEETLKMFK